MNRSRETDRPPEWATGLIVVHGNQAEALRDLVVAWIGRYPLAPLENETVLVQSNGMAQWLKLSLAEPVAAGGCGIAAALDLQLPSQFLWQAYRAVLGPAQAPEQSPFDKPRLLWRLVRLLEDCGHEPAYAPLRRYLDNDLDGRRRHQLAERLADLYDQYQVYRADWLRAWAQGQDVLLDARDQPRPLPAGQEWQPALWRALLADVAQDAAAAGARPGRAAVHDAFLAQVQQGRPPERPQDLPRRLIVFGISALPRQSLEVLAALAQWCQVLVCVHNPCRHHWADIVSDHDLLRGLHQGRGRQARRPGTPATIDPEQLHQHAHPLLAAWGKQGRDFIGLLAEHDDAATLARHQRGFQAIGRATELFTSPGTATLLQQLQDDILELRPLHETRDVWPPVQPAADASVRFHIAHSPQREVEVLHDQLLAAFEADPTLQPRDVIVMVPDIAGYAAAVQAVFGRRGADDPRHLPFRVVDQGQQATDPLLKALRTLLGLPQARLSASELLDLLDVPALAQRFGIYAADLPWLQRWIRGANVRWGLHAAHRAGLDLPEPPDPEAPHAWRFGLRRMLLGYAVGPAGGAWQGIEPYDEVGGLEATLLGSLVQLLDALEHAWHTLSTPATVPDWCDRFRALLRAFFDPATPDDPERASRDALTLLRLDGALEQWQAICEEARLHSPLPLAVAADHWLNAAETPNLSQRFFGGAVTFATLMPMRAIPFRHVCLLGMNDGDYPRPHTPQDFDFMARHYRPGDRSRRSDDHYMLLEALLSARERLYVSWVGRSITDNTERAPSVLIHQLRDHLASGWRLDGGGDLLAALTTEHRLQPFSPAYFGTHHTPTGDTPWFTYAHEWRRPGAPAPTSATPLPPLAREEPLTLAELTEFLQDPVKAFFRRRLGVTLALDDPTLAEHEPFDLDGLDRWRLHRELLQDLAQELPRGEASPAQLSQRLSARLDAMQRRGELAAGGFGQAQRESLAEPLPDLLATYAQALADWPDTFSATLDWAGMASGLPVAVLDRLDDLRHNTAGETGRVVLEVSALTEGRSQQYRPHRVIAHWVAHLAGHLAVGPMTTRILSHAGEITLAALPLAEATRHWQALLEAWQCGMQAPLPLSAKAGFAWLRAQGRAPDDAARAWQAAHDALAPAGGGGEWAHNPYLRRAYPTARDLLGPPDLAHEASPFRHWTEQLLRPLWQAIPVSRRSTPKEGQT